MFGRSQKRGGPPVGGAGSLAGGSSGARRRHGRRPIRSSLTGPELPDPTGRVLQFELDARGAIEELRSQVGDELHGVRIGVTTAPLGARPRGVRPRSSAVAPPESEQPLFYSIDREQRSIVLYRMPIQRARGLHVEDAEHRRLFVEHCVYRAVCEYLRLDPWDLLPGRFDHF